MFCGMNGIEVREVGEIAKFTPVELKEYEDSLKTYRDLKNSLDTAEEKGEAKGEAKERVIGTGTLVRYLSRICGTFPYDSVVPVPMIRVFIHCHIVFSINYSAKVQRIFVFSK